jgi:hypothetical protein
VCKPLRNTLISSTDSDSTHSAHVSGGAEQRNGMKLKQTEARMEQHEVRPTISWNVQSVNVTYPFNNKNIVSFRSFLHWPQPAWGYFPLVPFPGFCLHILITGSRSRAIHAALYISHNFIGLASYCSIPASVSFHFSKFHSVS